MASVGWRFGAFELDIRHRHVTRGADILKIVDSDIDLLRLLAKRAADNPSDPVIPRQTFFDLIWPGLVVNDKTLSQCMKRLRQILGVDVIPFSTAGGYALGCGAEALSTIEELEAELLACKLFDAHEASQTENEKTWDDNHVPWLGEIRRLWSWACAQPGRKHIAIRLAAGSARIWIRASKADEGADLLNQAVALLDSSVQLIDQARLLWGAASVVRDGDRSLAVQYGTRAVAAYRRLFDTTHDLSYIRSIAEIHILIADSQLFLGQIDEAERSLVAAKAILAEKEFCNRVPKAHFDMRLTYGLLMSVRLRLDDAEHHFSAAEDIAIALADPLRQGLVLLNRAELDYAKGDLDSAIVTNRRASKLMLEASAPMTYLLRPLVNTATFRALSGDVEGTRRSLRAALTLARHERGYWLCLCLQAAAHVIAQDGRHPDAARLLGFVDKTFATGSTARQAPEQALYGSLIAFLGDSGNLGQLGLEAWLRDGAGLTQAQAVELALNNFQASASNRLVDSSSISLLGDV